MKLFFGITLAALLLFVSCGKSERKEQKGQAAEEHLPKIVALGDSLTEGLGLPADQTYPAQLEKMLRADGFRYEVVNAGASGDTSSGGLRRIDWVMDNDTHFVIVELGANDILRGTQPDLIRENLAKIIERILMRKALPVLTGMEAPTNSGPEYRRQIHDLYAQLAERYKTPFVPFILEGIAGRDRLNQEDMTHPNAEGARIMAQNVYKVLRPLL